MSRRGENIRKRADGRWEGRYKVTDTITGKSRYCSVYARTYSDVRKKLLDAKKNLLVFANPGYQPKHSTKSITFNDVALEWLGMIEEKRKYSTFIKYGNIYKVYVQPTFGNTSIYDINQETLKNAKQDCPDISNSVMKSIACVMNQILKYAAQKYSTGLCTIVIDKQKNERKNIEVLTKTEQIKLICILSENRDIYKTGILLCLATGLRLGELCALKWEDIDFENKVLHVCRTVQRIAVQNRETKTILFESEPKSCYSKREIPLADEMAESLLPYRESEDYIFKGNQPMEPRTYQNKFGKYLKDAGIPKRNFHILRHTFATNCIDSGTDVKSLSEILGHSDVRITLNRYVHPTAETKRRHMNTLAVIYGQYMGQKCV